MSNVTALVSLFVEASRTKEVLEALSKLENIEAYSGATGDFDILGVVSCADVEELRNVLKNRIQKIPGVRNTVSSIILETHHGPRRTGRSEIRIVGPNSTF